MTGPLARLVAPPAPRVADWQVFAPTEVAPPMALPLGLPGIPGPGDELVGVTTFNYTLIPLTEQARATPSIPFSYFDPERGRYADLTIPPVPVTVKAGAAPGDLQALVQAAAPPAETEKEPVLSGLAASPGRTAATLVPAQQQAWFPLAQLAPAARALADCGAGTGAAAITRSIPMSSCAGGRAGPCAANGASCAGRRKPRTRRALRPRR